MTHSFSYQGDDFCVTHGREHMRYSMGNPIPWCQECEDERETECRGVSLPNGDCQ